MSSINKRTHRTEESEQYLQNKSHDDDFDIQAREMVGYDSVANALCRILVNAGKLLVKTDPAATIREDASVTTSTVDSNVNIVTYTNSTGSDVFLDIVYADGETFGQFELEIEDAVGTTIVPYFTSEQDRKVVMPLYNQILADGKTATLRVSKFRSGSHTFKGAILAHS